ncbi:hypothetical protein RJ639_023146 [Escallonia herrerae]|uniref:Integrase catalytic domain-containing protein n=1 Tax=Escallonia herrerae TaxID=1293975 RepID=A0AA88V0N2_9ASTE|nr:hypothetical protein RJ639_023146 [Escallonia herrerae]
MPEGLAFRCLGQQEAMQCSVDSHNKKLPAAVAKPFKLLRESISRAKASLELIYTDVCGSIDPASFGKNRYFLLFIDDYSRKTWVYFLKQKSEVFSNFKRFKALVKKQSGYQIKAMRSDRGGKFISKEFKALCEENAFINRLPFHIHLSKMERWKERIGR